MVRIPASDPTPPVAELEAQGAAGPIKLDVGGEARRVELRGNDSLILTGKAEDRGGIKDMVLQGNALVTCSDPSTGASYTRSTGFLRRHVPGSAYGGRAAVSRDSRFVLRAGDFERLCPRGRLQGAVGQARVQAANYHGGASTTPHLEFRIAANEVASQAIPMPVAIQTPVTAGPTGFAPAGGVGGSATNPDPSPVPVPRQCPRAAKPGRAAEARSSSPGPECLDTPVPSLSPPAPQADPPARPARGRDRRTSKSGAQKPQIRPLRSAGI